MDPLETIRMLADKLGCPIADRSSSESYNWDGKTHASHSTCYQENDSFELEKTGTRSYTPFDLLHDICHWLVAEPYQRELPEFGMSIGIVDGMALGDWGGEFRDSKGMIFSQEIVHATLADGLLDAKEQDEQEIAAQFLSIRLSKLLGIPRKLMYAPQSYMNCYWEEKIKARNSVKDISIPEIRRLTLRGMKCFRALMGM